MNKKQKNPILRVLEYDASRKYIGEFTGRALREAYHVFMHTRNHDKPTVVQRIKVGRIDEKVICQALLKQMSYNPKRFGNVSPFRINGRESVFYFCKRTDTEIFEKCPVLNVVREHLNDFITKYNRAPNGQWCDKIEPSDGYLTLHFYGCSDKNYKKLAALRDAVKAIVDQNVADFKLPEYRDAIIRAVTQGPKQTVFEEPIVMTKEEIAEDRMDKAEESAQITADSAEYRYAAQIEQAQQDLDDIKRMRMHECVH